MASDWRRDEIILICSALETNEWKALRASDQEAVRLSILLNEARYVPTEERDEAFRSPNSVQRKAYDLITLRPSYKGAPTKGGRTTREVLADWLADPEAMRDEARRIRVGIVEGAVSNPLKATREAEPPLMSGQVFGADEGAAVEVILKRRERDPALRARKLDEVRRAGTPISCEVCTFDFESSYGARGEGYIEVHHVLPLHVTGPTTTHLDDLVLLCANCHRMIHRTSPWLMPEQLVATLR